MDSVLILLMTLACGVGLRAIESGRLRTLLGCACSWGSRSTPRRWPPTWSSRASGLGYLVCAPGVLCAGLGNCWQRASYCSSVSASWSAIVELTPASKRPFVGGSTNNTEHNLTFDYNGLGRVEGQVGGPGRIPILVKHGSLAHIEREALRARAQRAAATRGVTSPKPPAPTGIVPAVAPRRASAPAPKPPPKYLPNGRAREPTAFGGTTGPLRLFKVELGGQAGWMLPFALFGMLAIALLSIGRSSATGTGRRSAARDYPETPDRPEEAYEPDGRRGPTRRAHGAQRGVGTSATLDRSRLAALIVLGGWFLIEAWC